MSGGGVIPNPIPPIVDFVESYRDQNPAVHKLWDYFYFLLIFLGGFLITFYFTVDTTPKFVPLVAFCIIVGIFLIFFIVYNFFYESNIKTLVTRSNTPAMLSVATIILGGLTTFISTIIVLVTLTYIMNHNKSDLNKLMVSDRNYVNIWRFIQLTFTKMAIIVPLAFILMYQNLDDDILENNIGENKLRALNVLLFLSLVIVMGISIADMFYSVELLKTKLTGAAGIGTRQI